MVIFPDSKLISNQHPAVSSLKAAQYSVALDAPMTTGY
jgi:hypothetical protein